MARKRPSGATVAWSLESAAEPATPSIRSASSKQNEPCSWCCAEAATAARGRRVGIGDIAPRIIIKGGKAAPFTRSSVRQAGISARKADENASHLLAAAKATAQAAEDWLNRHRRNRSNCDSLGSINSTFSKIK